MTVTQATGAARGPVDLFDFEFLRQILKYVVRTVDEQRVGDEHQQDERIDGGDAQAPGEGLMFPEENEVSRDEPDRTSPR